MGQRKNQSIQPKISPYKKFQNLDGSHPFKSQVPQGRIEYRVRKKKGGKITFFNFDLAREMGLIPENHPDVLSDELSNTITDTFSLVIINEYDEENNLKVNPEELLPETYMATRYLQLQHPDKTGKTSGDGRTIWNGIVEHKGKVWDISSCGTGATRLSPACNINKKFYKTGDPSVSYGCGLSEVSEGFETLFFSEVLSENGHKTERILAIVEFEKGLSINVRAYQNLMRPSHFFCHLKQGNLNTLKQVCDYYLDRQIKNGEMSKDILKNENEKYFELAKKVCKDFSYAAAKFEDEYIFCWLDWDGDNVLMDGGIIDYGSVRQFGLFHGEYRFDDVQRFSTTILEQKNKAKYIVQCFIQIADFISSGKRKSLSTFKDHHILREFDIYFEHCKNENILKKVGLRQDYRQYLLNHHEKNILDFRKYFTFFERAKSKRACYRVADGINRDTLFCMRDILRELPQIFLSRERPLSPQEFIEISKSSYAKKTDLKINSDRIKKVLGFQKSYIKFINLISQNFNLPKEKILLDVTMRSSVINKYDRVTGDSISIIVEKVCKERKKMSAVDIFKLSQDFVKYQNLNPDIKKTKNVVLFDKNKKLMRTFFSIVREFREGL